MNIYAKLLGDPQIEFNGKSIVFPYKKAEAIFYYLLVNKKASREKLTSLFWGDFNDKSAKKNLRDALYKVKRAFDFDIFISPKRAEVLLNPEINFHIDIDEFMKNSNIKLYRSEFLSGFYIKDCYDFDEWIHSTRAEFKSEYIKVVKRKLKEEMNFVGLSDIEGYANILLKEDPYNEKNYRDIMRLYSFREDYNRSMSVYYKLVDILKNDLDLEPEQSTTSLFKEILELRSDEGISTEPSSKFIGRKSELALLKSNLNKFRNGKGKSILVTGEAGIGRTDLLDKHLESISTDDLIVLNGKCYAADRDFFLQSWDSIFKQLASVLKKEKINIPKLWSDITSYFFPSFNEGFSPLDIDSIEKIESVKHQVSFDAIIGILNLVASKKPVILIFDDIHWMDSYSFNLLSNIVFKSSNIIFIATCRESYMNEIEKNIVRLLETECIETITLNRLSLTETEEFINKRNNNLNLTSDDINEIYKKSEGNTLFIIEYLNILKDNKNTLLDSSKVENILKSRLLNLSNLEKKILKISSVFSDRIKLNFLLKYVDADEFDFFDALESLQNKLLLKEVYNENDVYYAFYHSLMKDYIYNNLNKGIAKSLHEKLANYYESNLKNNTKDKYYYSRIIYHYENTENNEKLFEYNIKNLSLYSDMNFELFPSIHKAVDYENVNMEEAFEKLDQLLDKCNDNELGIHKLKMDYYYIKGIYYIRTGEYNQGLAYIESYIKYAEDLNSYNHMLQGYHQMIYYSIQVNELDNMNFYINKIEKIIEHKSDIKESGTLFRWKGLYNIRRSKYEQAEKHLNRSIEIFENLSLLENKYSLNIAACYNYLGNIYKYKNNFKNALTNYKKAIDICEKNNIVKGLDMFYTGLGQSYYELGKFKLSKEYILKALDYYKKFNNLWGRSIAEGYAALLYKRENNIISFNEHLKQGEYYSQKIRNPYSLRLIERIKAENK